MRYLLVGDYRDNNGPNNVNKEIIRYKSKRFSHVCMTNRYWKYQDALLKILRSDVIVVSGTSKLNLFAMKTAKKLGKKTAYIMHGCDVYEAGINGKVLPDRVIRQEEELLEFADLILTVSAKHCQWVKKHFPQHADKTDIWQLGVVWHQPEFRDQCCGTTVAAAGGSLPLKRNQIVSNAVELLGGSVRLMVYGPTQIGEITSNPHTNWVGNMNNEDFLDGLRAADVFVVKVPHTPGSLQNILKTISDEEISIEYMYGLSVGGPDASIVVKTSDFDRAREVFKNKGIETLTAEDLKSLS
jgi:hypothetical protein